MLLLMIILFVSKEQFLQQSKQANETNFWSLPVLLVTHKSRSSQSKAGLCLLPANKGHISLAAADDVALHDDDSKKGELLLSDLLRRILSEREGFRQQQSVCNSMYFYYFFQDRNHAIIIASHARLPYIVLLLQEKALCASTV